MTNFPAWQPGVEVCGQVRKALLTIPSSFSRNLSAHSSAQANQNAFASTTNRSEKRKSFEKMAQQKSHEGFFGKLGTNPSVSPAEVTT